MIANASPGQVLASLIRQVGLGTASGDWKTTYGLMPSELPTRRISSQTTTPLVHGKDRDGTHSQHYGVQTLVRADTMEVGYAKSVALVNRLCQITPATKITVTIGSFSYDVTHCVLASGPVYLRTQENKDAEMWATNFLFTCTEY